MLAVRVPLMPASSRPSAWVDVSIAHDDNVFETMNDVRSDVSARLLFQGSCRRRTGGGTYAALNVQGAVEVFRRFPGENRSLNQIVLGCDIPVRGPVSAGFDSDVRFKTFFEADRGYAFFKCAPFLKWRMGRGWNTTAFFAASRLNFAGGSQYDYHARIGGVRVDWAAASGALFGFQYILGDAFYQRQAYALFIWSKNSEQWNVLGNSQRDSYGETSLQFEWTRWIFLRGGLGYEINRSNSYGYAYRRPKVSVLAVKSVTAGWTIGFFWTSQVKKYTDSLRPILQISPESENEENNCVLIDATRSFNQAVSLKFQAGLYRNESPFRNLYYKKTLYSVGLTRRF